MARQVLEIHESTPDYPAVLNYAEMRGSGGYGHYKVRRAAALSAQTGILGAQPARLAIHGNPIHGNPIHGTTRP